MPASGLRPTSASGGFAGRFSVAMVTLAVALRWPTFVTRLFDADEAAIGVQAMVVRSGGTLYRDVFDRKPPLPPLAYAASFALTNSHDVRPLRVLVTLALAGAAIVVGLDARRRHGATAGWWAGVLMVCGAMALFPADAGAANYAHFALLPGTAALVWTRRRGAGWALAGGVALGLAVLCRQSWLLAAVPACWSAWRVGRWRSTITMVAAAVAVVLTTGLYAPLGGFWQWNVANSPGFVFASAGVLVSIGRGAASTAAFVGFHVTAAVCLVAAWRAADPLRRADPLQRADPLKRSGRTERDLWLWLLFGLFSVAAGLRFFGHYWLQVLPPVVVLAAPVVARAAGRWRTAAIAGLVVPAIVAFALLFVPGSFHHRPDPRDLAAAVDARTTPSQRVFVWGSYPEVLLAAGRLPAGGLVHMDFVTGRSGGRNDPATTLADATPGAVDILLASLRAHPPALVLDTSTAPGLGYQAYPLSIVPEVQAFVRAGYVRVAVVDGVTIYAADSP